jgi:hypothetical protein
MATTVSKLAGVFVASLLFATTYMTAVAQDSPGPRDWTRIAAKGAAIAAAEPAATALRDQLADDEARRGFDIGLAVAEKDTLPGPGKQRIHDTLPVGEQAGYDAAVAYSLERNRKAQAVMKESEQSTLSALRPAGDFRESTSASKTSILALIAPTYIGDLKVETGWHLLISFTSTQKTKPLVEIGRTAPVTDHDGNLTFPSGSGATSRFVSLDNGRYYADFDVLREGFEAGAPYYYIVNVFGDGAAAAARDQRTGRFTMAGTGAPGYVCDDHEVHGIDGSVSECKPYLCQAGQCLKQCASVDDCAAPAACTPSGECVYPGN